MQVVAAKGYQSTNVNTVDSLRLVIMCYEGCIANAARAQAEMKKGNLAEKGMYLSKATAIVSELMSVLDKEKGGDIAERLESIYQYVLHVFSQANLQMSPALIDDGIRVLRELKDGWETIYEKGDYR